MPKTYIFFNEKGDSIGVGQNNPKPYVYKEVNMINNISAINTSNKVLTAYRNQLDINTTRQTKTGGADAAHISSEGQEFKAVLDAVINAPDIREERVLEIKNKMSSGQYNINSRDIATKMLNEGWL